MPNSLSDQGLRRIRRLALLVRLLCLLGLVVVATLPFVFWAQADWVAEVAQGQWGLKQLQLDTQSRLMGLAASMVHSGVILFALWQMWALFGCFAEGELLAVAPASHLRRLGLALCVQSLAQPLSRTLSVLALTWGNPPGERQLWVGFSSDHYLSLLFGLVLLALAQVLFEGARVAQENQEFI